MLGFSLRSIHVQSQYTFDHFPVFREIWWDSLSLSNWSHFFPLLNQIHQPHQNLRGGRSPQLLTISATLGALWGWVHICSPDFPLNNDFGMRTCESTNWLYQYPVLLIFIYAACSPAKHRNGMQEPPGGSRACRLSRSLPSSYNLSFSLHKLTLSKATSISFSFMLMRISKLYNSLLFPLQVTYWPRYVLLSSFEYSNYINMHSHIQNFYL